MIFRCWDINTKKLVFKYIEPNDNHKCSLIENFDFSEKGTICCNERYFLSKIHSNSNLIFAFCIDNVKVRKPASFIVKHAINMFLAVNPAIESKQKQYEEIIKTSIHNTKNLNSQITSIILNHLNEQNLSTSSDKVDYINNLIQSNPYAYAKVIISVLKLSSQITSEYNVIDYLKPNIIIQKSEFCYGKIHSLLVLAFYHLEYDFHKKNIRVSISKTLESGYFNFNTIQTALIHILGNALRYGKPHTTIRIETIVYDEKYIDIIFNMCSLYLTDSILEEGFLNGKRDVQAREMHPKGTGLGLGIIKKLVELNRGEFMFSRENDTMINDNGYKYGFNIFSIRLLRNEFYN